MLVIDDEANFCRVLEARLARSGFTVILAPDVATGRHWLVTRTFDLILLDVRLPDANGLAALPALRAMSAGAPFLLMTAYEEENLRARALLAGAADILYKPFDLDTLVVSVQRLLEHGSRFSALQIGQAVVLKRSDGPDVTEVDARIARKSADAFAVAAGRPLTGTPGDTMDVQLPGDDGIYEFSSTVLGTDRDNQLVLTKPDLIRRHQRRQRSRAPLSVPVRVTAADHEVERVCMATTTDISIGGVALLSREQMPFQGAVIVSLQMPLDQNGVPHAIRARGEIARSQQADIAETGVYRVVVAFRELTDADAECIEAYATAATRA